MLNFTLLYDILIYIDIVEKYQIRCKVEIHTLNLFQKVVLIYSNEFIYHIDEHSLDDYSIRDYIANLFETTWEIILSKYFTYISNESKTYKIRLGFTERN